MRQCHCDWPVLKVQRMLHPASEGRVTGPSSKGPMMNTVLELVGAVFVLLGLTSF